MERSVIRSVWNSGVPLLVVRLAVGGLFVYLAWNKALDPVNFMKLTHEYGVLPVQPPYLNLTGVLVPWIELVCGLALILGVFVRGAALTILGMLLFFAPLLLLRAYSLYTDPANAGVYASFCDVKFDCGCGTGEVYICAKMIENTFATIGAAIVLLVSRQRLCLGPVLGRWAARRLAAVAAQGAGAGPIR